MARARPRVAFASASAAAQCAGIARFAAEARLDLALVDRGGLDRRSPKPGRGEQRARERAGRGENERRAARQRIMRSIALAPGQQLQDRRRGLLDRAAGHVDHRPVMFGEEPARLRHFLAHRVEIGVVAALFLLVQHAQAVLPDLDEALGIVGEADDQRPRRGEKLRRQRQPGTIGTFAALMPRLAR